MNATDEVLRRMFADVGGDTNAHSSHQPWTVENDQRIRSLECCHDVCDFLGESLDYDPEITAKLYRFAGGETKRGNSWLRIVEAFSRHSGETGFWVITFEDETDMLSGVVRY